MPVEKSNNRIDVSLDGLHEIQHRIDHRRLEERDWPVLSALLGNFVGRQEARVQRMLDKMAADAAAAGEQTSESSDDDSNPVVAASGADEDGSGSSTRDDEPAPNPGTLAANGAEDGKGHGRNGASAFTNAKHFFYGLVAGVIGSLCEACSRGRMTRYRQKVTVRIVGQPLFGVELHHAEQARCRICGCIITAALPAGVGDGIGKSVTYHWTACATLIVMHYFAGLPFKRLESLHESWGIPLSDANQWEIVDGSMGLLSPLLKALEKYAIANLTSFLIDDTGAMVIELRRQIEAECEAAKALGLPKESVRTGINATCAYIETARGKIILFYTGRHHAGEIIDVLMKRRPEGAEQVVKVTDGASKNFDHTQSEKMIEGVCNAHAFLKFRAVKDQFPAEYALIAEAYNKVFENDAHALTLEMSPADRFIYHKRHSEPWMKKIKRMCEEKIRDRLVEPRSPLWEPVTFIINQWPRLTKFLQTPGVPIHTNIVEQNLIIPVRYLAASFNFKNQTGADAGDEAMALTVTARANGVEPVAYIAHCLEHHEDLKLNPEKYLPWAYRERLKANDKPPHTPTDVIQENASC